ncbi:hypothetical protein SRHO_G00048780 [Serrasalmus rhombeus]
MNHFAKMWSRKVHAVDDEIAEQCSSLFVGVVQSQPQNEEWTISLKIERSNVHFKLDSGAQANVIPYSLLQRLGKKNLLRSTNVKLSTYTGDKIHLKGKCNLEVRHKNKRHVIQFMVAKNDITPILGIQTCVEMKLIQRVQMLNKSVLGDIFKEYADVFVGIGCLDGEHTIKVDEKVTPKVHPPRKIPVTLREKLKTELKRMEKIKIIAKIDEPTQWVNPFVIVEKTNGNLRICLDPRDLNTAVMREHYQLPTVEEITCRLAKAKYFSVLDASSGFWQLKLDNASSQLCTFNTPFGRYRFLRLPFGINSAPEVFHRTVKQLFEGIDGLETYIDDILVWGATIEQHDQRLRQVLERSRVKNFRLNKEKCKIGLEEIKYLGHILSKDGLKPDPSKIEAIRKMPTPECKKDVERFLGMVTFLAKFIPNMSQHTEPLRELNRDDAMWQWQAKHQQAFEKLKTMLTEAPVLKYYDVSLPVTVSVDASKCGLGAVLLQEDRPVAYASRALTETEQRYAQIEKEMLAIVFGVERFHQFVYGREINVQTDHKPLEAIMKKPLTRAPARIQRLLMRLHRYQLRVQYKPGKEMQVADALSRAYLPQTDVPDAETEAQQEYLLLVDYYSKFTEIEWLGKDTKSAIVISHLKSQFARHGIPDIVISDNGPQFISREFQTFATQWEFCHKTTSPHHAQSNGMAERGVQTVKLLLKKAKADGKDPYLSLLNLRNTPLEDLGASPAQLLMGRRTKTRLPTPPQLLEPRTVTSSVKQLLERRQRKQKEYYDQGSKLLQKLQIGDSVRIWRDGTWNPAHVTALTEHPRSYVVRTPDGQQYRRNRKFLMKTKHGQSCEATAMDSGNEQQIAESERSCATKESNAHNKPSDLGMSDKMFRSSPVKTLSGRVVKKPQRLIEE